MDPSGARAVNAVPRLDAGRWRRCLVLVLLLSLAAAALAGCAGTPEPQESVRPSQDTDATPHGAIAHATAKTFARSVYPRASGTWGEIKAREFVLGTFQQYDYHPRLQEFIFEHRGDKLHSANVIAVKEGESADRIVVGAHYDAVAVGGEGYMDNGSGVGLLLELAARLKSVSTPYTIVFIAFGAEERGLNGSRHYVRAMTDQERSSTLGMINLDGVAGGDKLYVFNRHKGASWLRDDVRAAADDLGIRLIPAPSRDGKPTGTSAALTDDLPFHWWGYPTVVLSATNWSEGKRDGRTQSAKHGAIWDTPQDTVEFVEEAFPGRMKRQLSELSRLLEVVLTSVLETKP